jgi:hypothetical protein
VPLTYENFNKIVTDYEATHGDLPGMYRDPRGVLYHPHLGQEIALGTLAVEQYEQPPWTFNKVLYCEKEGFLSILRHDRWPERHDCALLTSKGYPSRAARDLLDLLGESDEPLQFFCIHDADAAGTMIYQALQEGTAARGAREVEIINLGLGPWEALEMDLQVEQIERKGKGLLPVAWYVLDRDDGPEWDRWLQNNRVELNAMTSPEFIAWLDDKMEQHGEGKVIPPDTILRDRLVSTAEEIVRERTIQEILEKAGLDQRVMDAMNKLAPHIDQQGKNLAEVVQQGFDLDGDHGSEAHWRELVDRVSERIATKVELVRKTTKK